MLKFVSLIFRFSIFIFQFLSKQLNLLYNLFFKTTYSQLTAWFCRERPQRGFFSRTTKLTDFRLAACFLNIHPYSRGIATYKRYMTNAQLREPGSRQPQPEHTRQKGKWQPLRQGHYNWCWPGQLYFMVEDRDNKLMCSASCLEKETHRRPRATSEETDLLAARQCIN